MIIEHCMVNGERCSKCCEVLTMKESSSFREWRAWCRKYDVQGKEDKLYKMVRKISKRRAKKINPHLVSIVNNNQAYFTCKNLTSSGCGIYEDRPDTCSGFPYYGKSKDEYLKEYKECDPDYKGKNGLYTPDCTYHIDVKEVL